MDLQERGYVSLSMEGTLARALYSFQAENPGELSVPQGGIIRITQYINKHWLEASYKGETGWFPVTYTERLENGLKDKREHKHAPSRQHISNELNDILTKQSSPDRSVVETAFAFCARNDSELTFPSDALIEVIKDVDEDWMEGSFNGRIGLFPKSYIKSFERPCARAVYPFVGESAGELTFREGDHIFLRKRLNSQWMEGEINGIVGLFPSSFVAVEVDLPPEQNTFENELFSFVDSYSKPRDQSSAIIPNVEWKHGMKGKAMFHFTALYSGDLELNKGDVVTVLDIDDDNWIEGQLDNGICGACPAAYLEPIYDISTEFSDRKLQRRTQRLASDESFSALFDNLVSDAGYFSASHKGQQGNSSVESSPGKDRKSYNYLLDSSFTLDPTPTLLPSNLPTSKYTSETMQIDKPIFKSRPAIGTKPTQSYSVKYLGGESRQEPSTSKSHQTVVSSVVTLPSHGRVTMSNAKERAEYFSSETVTSHKHSQFHPSSYQNSTRTWPDKRSGNSGHMSLESTSGDFDDEFDLLSGNCTSLPSPLLPLPQRGLEDRNNESSASDDSPITPRRPAPPPPKRNSSHKIHMRSSTLPAHNSKGLTQGHLNGKGSMLKGKDHQHQLDLKYIKQNGKPHNIQSALESSRHAGVTLGESSKSRLEDKSKPLAKPHSVYWKDMVDSGDGQQNLRRSNSLEQVNQKKFSSITQSDQQSVNKGGSPTDEMDVPGLTALQERIAEAEENLKKEMKVYTGFKTISQLVMTDPVKQREMEAKVSQSQQKITEWEEELKHLQDEQVFLMESHRKKMLKVKIGDLETDLDKQIRSQRSLEMLLGVVEENRKKEVMENLEVCAQLVDKIRTKITELEASLYSLTEKPAASSQKHMAEQRQRVVTELINTEKDYCNDLELCVNYFLRELQYSQVKDLDCEGLFGNIESVLKTSQKLLASLENAVDNTKGNDQELGKCFVDIADEMKEVYAVYCRNHDDAISLVEKYEEIPDIQDAFTKCLDKIREHTRCWNLSSFLIKPVQRVLKYPLLLNELLKYTAEIHRDKYNLIKAISVMTDVANAINEFKRRKDLVVKYKKVEDSGLTNMIQKLNWHSVVKKGSRFNQRLTQLTGLVSQTVDEKFIEEEKRFRIMEKTVKTMSKNISVYLEDFKEAMDCHKLSGQNVSDFYREASTCSEVSTFLRIQKKIGETVLTRFMDSVQTEVLSPLNTLLNLFQGPQRLIQKRNDKCLDYDHKSNKIDKIKDREKLKAAKEELELAKKNYEALNTQLLEEIPGFTEKCMALVLDCLENFALAQKKLYSEVHEDYDQLLQLPVVQEMEEDVIEHHNKRSMEVMEQFSELSFIPCSFVAKDSSRKKRRSTVKSPNMPSNQPDTVEDDSGNKTSLLDSTPNEEGGEVGVAKREEPTSSSPRIRQPRPAPRRLSRIIQPESKDNDISRLEGKSPGDGKLYVVEYNFVAQSVGELSVSEGDIVSVLQHSDSSGNPEWWLIRSNAGSTGFVPESYLSPVGDNVSEGDGHADAEDGESSSVSNLMAEKDQDKSAVETSAPLRFCADFAFEASSAAELSVDEGQIVVVLQKQDLTGNDEWWLVEAQGRKGYVPSSYLTQVDD